MLGGERGNAIRRVRGEPPKVTAELTGQRPPRPQTGARARLGHDRPQIGAEGFSVSGCIGLRVAVADCAASADATLDRRLRKSRSQSQQAAAAGGYSSVVRVPERRLAGPGPAGGAGFRRRGPIFFGKDL